MYCASLPDYPPTLSFGGFGRVRVFSFDQYYIFTILNMIKIFKSKVERLEYHIFQYLVWAAIFETGIYFEILYYFIYPAYLGS
jgi:hypothetical protein